MVVCVCLLIVSISIANAAELYLIIGQSNAAGRDRNIDLYNLDAPSPDVKILTDDNQAMEAVQPLNRYSTIGKEDGKQGVCLGLNFGKRMYELTGNPTLLIVNARGSTRIGHWLRGQQGMGYFEASVERVRAAQEMNATLRGILWNQGEGNIKSDGSFLESYFTKLLPRLILDFREEFGHVPFLMGQLYDNMQNSRFNEAAKIVNTPEFPLKDVDWISSRNLTAFDDTHFDAASARELGMRYADIMYRVSTQMSSDSSDSPSTQPSIVPTEEPSMDPMNQPSSNPSMTPTIQPSSNPSRIPTAAPTLQPSSNPTSSTILALQPSSYPSSDPSIQPSSNPSSNPSIQPSSYPSSNPFLQPSSNPSSNPSLQPSSYQSPNPFLQPSSNPSFNPSLQPSSNPSSDPSLQPSSSPTSNPSLRPSSNPSGTSLSPAMASTDPNTTSFDNITVSLFDSRGSEELTRLSESLTVSYDLCELWTKYGTSRTRVTIKAVIPGANKVRFELRERTDPDVYSKRFDRSEEISIDGISYRTEYFFFNGNDFDGIRQLRNPGEYSIDITPYIDGKRGNVNSFLFDLLRNCF